MKPTYWIACALGLMTLACGDINEERSARLNGEPFLPEAPRGFTQPMATTVQDDTPQLPDGCAVALQVPYAPFSSTSVTQFPDDVLVVPDVDSPTGLRIDVGQDFAWVSEVPEAVPGLIDDLNTLSGFALSGEIFFEFDTSVVDPETTDIPNAEAVFFLNLDDPNADPIHFDLRYGLEGHAVLVRPVFPLNPGTRYAVLVTTEILGPKNTCVVGHPSVSARLDGTSVHPRLAELGPAYRQLIELTGVQPENVAAMTVFTTHDDTGPMKKAAEYIRNSTYDWEPGATCERLEHYRKCTVNFKATDFRGPQMIVTAEPGEKWTLPVAVWLPLDAPGPYPVIIYGHGINSGRHEGDYFARHFSDLGYAIIGADALRHGDHPTRDVANTDLTALDILGVNIGELQISASNLRSNFNQTILDRLQLLQLIKSKPDFDADGIDDLDSDILVYFGVSLGGMLGSGFCALAEGLDAVVLSISGGHLVKFVTDMEAIRMVRPLLGTIFGSLRDFERFLAIAQSAVDAADPVTYGPSLLSAQRLEAGQVPSIMMPVSIYDSTVPPSTGIALARAIGLPHLTPVASDVFGLKVESTPARYNGANEKHTLGFFQFDRISKGNGEIELSDHASTPKSPEGRLQVRHYLETILTGDGPEIIDPYTELMTPPLSDITEGR